MELKPISAISRIGALAVLFGLFAFALPKEDDPLGKLVTALQKWADTTAQEKVYLHMDKPYYAVGDTIWFKGYITTGGRHQLSAISGALYVDLISEQDSMIRSLKIPVRAGMTVGDIVLGDELKEGNYRIRAYTQWMRNAGEAYFFDKTFTVGSVPENDIVTKANYQYQAVDGKQVLTATLNYTDDKNQPLANKNVQYRLIVDKNQILIKNAKTDEQGNIQLTIANDNKADLNGAYIRTSLINGGGKDVVKDFPIKANLSQSDVQFFPESGNLVNGIPSRVAFKAVGVDGLGLNIGGKILDNDHKEVADIVTNHAGMGDFILKPEANKTYTAKISFADGSTKSITLPKANDEGYVLSVYQPNKDSILVRVQTGAKQMGNPQNVNLIAQTGGEAIFASALKIEKPMTSVWLDKKDFPTGIAQFTLFNASGEPLNERVAFIRSNDQLKLNIKTSKATYKSREQVAVELEAKDATGKPTIGNFSVSVIDESKLPLDEANETSIFSCLLLSSDIKGYIEKPNYYFTDINDEVDKALDNLMLTQGYRRFEWKALMANNSATANSAVKFPAEGFGINVSGQVSTLTHHLLPNATVTLLSIRANLAKFATADAQGRFKFEGIVVKDSIKFTVQARTSKNGDKVALVLDSLPSLKTNHNPNWADVSINIPEMQKAYIDAERKQDEMNEKMGRMDQVHRLRQVNVRAAMAKKDVIALQGALRIAEGSANKTFTPKENESPTLGTFLMSHLGAGVIFQNYRPSRNPPSLPYESDPYEPEIVNCPLLKTDSGYRPLSIILDGRLLRESELGGVFDNTSVEMNDIAKIDFVNRNPALTSMLGTGMGVLLIYTKHPGSRSIYEPSIANITPKGFNKVRDFYSPKYDKPELKIKQPDTRSTIYWNPFVKTGQDGKAVFSFFNADDSGSFKITVEGINAEGQLCRQVYRYKVATSL